MNFSSKTFVTSFLFLTFFVSASGLSPIVKAQSTSSQDEIIELKKSIAELNARKLKAEGEARRIQSEIDLVLTNPAPESPKPDQESSLSSNHSAALPSSLKEVLNSLAIQREELAETLPTNPPLHSKDSDPAQDPSPSIVIWQENPSANAELNWWLKRLEEGRSLRQENSEIATSTTPRQTATVSYFGNALSSFELADGKRGLGWLPKQSPQFRYETIASFGYVTHHQGDYLYLDPSSKLEPNQDNTSEFSKFWSSGGALMYPLSAVAGLGLLLMIERLIYLFLRNGRNLKLLPKIQELALKEQWQEAEEACAKAKGLLGGTLYELISRRDEERSMIEERLHEKLLREVPKLQRFLSGIAVLAAVAPLLGLLGTVTGIIRTFRVIRLYGNANPGLLAGGISEALTTTAAGLIIAIPLLLAHGLMRGRVDRLLSDTEANAAGILNSMKSGRP